MRAPYTVEVTQVDSLGFYVKVGCKTLVYAELGLLLLDLKAYFEDPQATIKNLSHRYGWDTPEVEETPVQPSPLHPGLRASLRAPEAAYEARSMGAAIEP